MAFEILAAGVDTTTLTLIWSCYALSTGILQLKPREVFTESHLEVIHRIASVVPMALPHHTRFDSRIGGYFIPKGSVVFYNLYAVHQSQARFSVQKNNKGCNFCQIKNKTPKYYQCVSAMPFSIGTISTPDSLDLTS